MRRAPRMELNHGQVGRCPHAYHADRYVGEERNVNERDDFLHWVRSSLRDAEIALHNGDAEPRIAVWTTKEPVTLLGAWMTATNQQELRELFDGLARTFSNCSAHAYEVIAADVADDMAYTVGYEHTTAEVDGELRTYSLRVTQLYRREAGAWKVMHRHADTIPGAVPGAADA
jgi:ketosteroid isomerase-like protein